VLIGPVGSVVVVANGLLSPSVGPAANVSVDTDVTVSVTVATASRTVTVVGVAAAVDASSGP
jgi:hypothetical protein